jgi:uncharacterized protein
MNSRYLLDIEDVFDESEEKTLKQLLKKTSKIKNDHIYLLTVSDIGSYENFEKYAYAVSNQWKLGPRGILIVMSKNKRMIRIETSTEVWSRLSDEECLTIINNQIVPRFKEGKYFEGIKKGLLNIAEELK